MTIKWLDDLTDEELSDKNVLCRVDFNVPLAADGTIEDATRITQALPTLRRLIKANVKKLVIISHLGRPKAKAKPELSLQPIAEYLRDLLGTEIIFVHDCVSPGVSRIISTASKGSIIFLENLRFSPGEENNDLVFSKLLAKDMDIYVNDAFACSHREHASIVGVTKFIPEKVGGCLLKKEIDFFKNFLFKAQKPFVAVVGGAKVSTKIGVLTQLMKKVDCLMIGGAMAYTFLKAMGHNVGKSLVEEDKIQIARSLLTAASEQNVKILLPVDNVVCSDVKRKTNIRTINSDAFGANDIGVDIGEKTAQMFCDEIKRAQTVFFNGPVGICSEKEFEKGTMAIALALSETKAFTVAGGGDSISALEKAKVLDKIDFVSTGGGASLEILQGKSLPGLLALEN